MEFYTNIKKRNKMPEDYTTHVLIDNQQRIWVGFWDPNEEIFRTQDPFTYDLYDLTFQKDEITHFTKYKDGILYHWDLGTKIPEFLLN